MVRSTKITIFEGRKIRRHWDEKKEKWYFSVVDVVAVLSNSTSPLAYWRKMKERLKKEGSETVTKCHGLKMLAADGKMRLTDVAVFAQSVKYFFPSDDSNFSRPIFSDNST